jgi:hypothetical protein
MSLPTYYGVLLFGLLLMALSAVRSMKPGRGLIAFANDVIYIVLLVPALLLAARQVPL